MTKKEIIDFKELARLFYKWALDYRRMANDILKEYGEDYLEDDLDERDTYYEYQGAAQAYFDAARHIRRLMRGKS